jgi:hypothetical protein
VEHADGRLEIIDWAEHMEAALLSAKQPAAVVALG